MLRKILFLLFLFSTQTLYSQKFNAGIRAGIVGSQVNGDGLSGFNKAGLLGGLYVNRNLNDFFTLQMEMVYIQKGSRKPTDDNNTYYRMRVHYIEVPLRLRWHVGKKLDVAGGASFGTLIFSEENDHYGVYKNTIPFEKFEASYNFGIIYKLSDRWAFDGRYSHSINTIRPFPGTVSTFFDKGQYNVLIELTLLYLL